MKQKDFMRMTPEQFREELEKALDDERYEGKTQEIERVVNDMSLDEDKLAMIMAETMQRSNQQTFTRLCAAWLRLCGSPHYRTDGRNEASKDMGKAFLMYAADVYLPFV